MAATSRGATGRRGSRRQGRTKREEHVDERARRTRSKASTKRKADKRSTKR